MQQTKHILDALFSIAPVSCTLERTQMQETLCKFSQGIHKTELQFHIFFSISKNANYFLVHVLLSITQLSPGCAHPFYAIQKDIKQI